MNRHLLLLLAAAGLCACDAPFVKSGEFQAYEQFMEARRNGNCPDMEALVEEAAKTYVDGICVTKTLTLYGRTTTLPSLASEMADVSAAPGMVMARVIRKIESETRSAGETALVVLQKTISRKGETVVPAVRHRVKIRKFGTSLKLVEFVEEPAS